MAATYNIKGTTSNQFSIGKNGPQLIKNGDNLEITTPSGSVVMGSLSVTAMDVDGTPALGDAPIDGSIYGRQDGAWLPIEIDGNSYFRMSGFFTAPPEVNEILMLYVVDVPIVIPSNWAGSQIKLVGLSPADTFTISIRKNSVTEIGTIVIESNGTSSLTTTGGLEQTLTTGDILSIHAPGVTDNVTNVTWLLRGNKQ